MLSKKEVVSIDFSNPKKVEMKQLFQFKFLIEDQPDLAVFCENQQRGIVASVDDALWLNLD